MAKSESFKKSLSRLEEISKEIENDDLELEKSIKLYKEGVELALYCSEFLNNVEQEVFVLKQNVDKTFELTPFEDLD